MTMFMPEGASIDVSLPVTPAVETEGAILAERLDDSRVHALVGCAYFRPEPQVEAAS